MKKYIAWISVLLIFTLSGCTQNMAVKSGYDFSKVKRIAVLDFSGYRAEGVADIIIIELMKYGIDIVERNKIENLFREQQMVSSGAIDSSTARSIGKLLGVDAIMTGSVVGCLPAQRRTEYFARGDTPVVTPGLFILERGDNYITYQQDSEVSMSARLIDVETGSVVWAASDSSRGFSTESGIRSVALSLAVSLESVFPKKK